MPSILRTAALLAGEVVENILQGSPFEFARGPGVYSTGAVATDDSVKGSFSVGASILADEFDVPILTTYPIIPDHIYATDVVQVGDRLVQRFRNTHATLARTVRSLSQLSYSG